MSWYIILIVALLFLALVCRKELKRKNRKRLLLRLSAFILAIAGLLFLAFPFKKKNGNKSAGKIILLTEGFANDSLDNFIQNDKASFFTADLSIATFFPGKNVQFISSLTDFFNSRENDTIHVFGNGFSKTELTQLNKSSFVFHSNENIPAITSVYWKQQLKPGEPLHIQGKYDNSSNKKIKISLKGFGETFDSSFIASHSQKEFSLITTPKHEGKAVYSLLVISEKDTLQNEPIALNIQPAAPLKLLLLSSSPDFEKTFLKNKLSQSGYEITARTVISKEKSSQQFINMQPASSDLMSPASLEKFDIIIADDDAIAQLNASQSTNLRLAIEEKGVGLLVKLSTLPKKSSFYSGYFPSFALQQDKKPFITIHSSMNSNSYKLKIEEPICLRNEKGTQILLKDEQSNIYASNVIYGQGRIVATTLNNTYTLALAGDTRSWESFWSLLLNKAAKKILPAENWDIAPALPLVNEPISLRLNNNMGISQTIIGDSKVYLQKDPLLAYQSEGMYWPAESGWQSLIQQNGKILSWYAFDTGNWKVIRDYQKLKDTKEYTLNHPLKFIQQSAGQSYNWTSHLRLYLVILFFICCSILWVEQKLG